MSKVGWNCLQPSPGINKEFVGNVVGSDQSKIALDDPLKGCVELRDDAWLV
jgi:hypothetical protein